MPMISMILHLAFIQPDWLVTGVTTLGKAGLKACCAKGFLLSEINNLDIQNVIPSCIPHNVSLTAKYTATVSTLEVAHVPMVSFCLGALISEDDLNRIKCIKKRPPAVSLYWNEEKHIFEFENVLMLDIILWLWGHVPHDTYYMLLTSSQWSHRGFISSAWCRPQYRAPSAQ